MLYKIVDTPHQRFNIETKLNSNHFQCLFDRIRLSRGLEILTNVLSYIPLWSKEDWLLLFKVLQKQTKSEYIIRTENISLWNKISSDRKHHLN